MRSATEPEPAPVLDLAMIARDAEAGLEPSVRALRRRLDHDFPVPVQITIVDGASTDATAAIADRLARTVDGVRTIHMDGGRTIRRPDEERSRSLRAAWSTSEAQVVAGADIAAPIDLRALARTVDAVVTGGGPISPSVRHSPGPPTAQSACEGGSVRGRPRAVARSMPSG